MKTQVIHLEAYDDRHSIIDRLNWGQADRIILIWPLRGAPLDSKLDLKLIQRRCRSAGMKLALVCKKRLVKDHASDLGIPVFRSLRQAQKTVWEDSPEPEGAVEPPPRKYTREELAALIEDTSQPGWTQHKTARRIAFSLSILAVAALVLFLVPGAQIEYLPNSETQTLSLILTANPDVSVYNLSGTVPAERLSITVEGRAETESSGETGIPDEHATGIIVLTNLTGEEIEVPEGTIIRTADPNTTIRFATSLPATVEPEAGASARVPIEAVNPGLNGNLPPNTLVVIEDDLSRSLSAANPERTAGGSEQTSAAPTAEDYETLSQDLLASLWKTALQEAELLLEEGDMILDSAPRQVTILEETFSPPEPQPSAVLTLLLRAEYEILILRWTELEAMGNASLDVTLPAGYVAQPETFAIEIVGEPEFGEDELVTMDTVLSREIFESQSLTHAINLVQGKTPQKAREILQSELDLKDEPVITLFPRWWPLLPLTQIRIEATDLIQE